jgi:nitrite reductase/ring-hydroxylating ferredoxin subunit
VVSAVPAAVAGWVDWSEQHEHQARIGLVHAATIGVTIWLYAGSWAARACDRQDLGRALGLAGLSTASLGALLGGHLAYRHTAGANKAEPVRHLLEPRWYDIGHTGEFPAGQSVRRHAGEVQLVVVHETESGGALRVLAERCSYCSGPLAEGELVDGCVQCPWHGCTFRLVDGWNVGGPATAPQPCFDVRATEDGVVQVRYPGAG